MRFFKNGLSIILSLLLCFSLSVVNVEAADGEYLMGEIIDGSRLINDSESSGAVGGNTRGTYLGSGSSHITDCGNGLVYVSGTTDCNRKSSSVSVTVQLERLENGSWHYVTDRSFSDSNTTSVSGSFYISVKKGYYYRVCGQHTASANGVTESTTSQTDGIWIG